MPRRCEPFNRVVSSAWIPTPTESERPGATTIGPVVVVAGVVVVVVVVWCMRRRLRALAGSSSRAGGGGITCADILLFSTGV